MAGVGFSLRVLARDRSLGGIARYVGAAAMLSSGPWLISILALLFVGLVGRTLGADAQAVDHFQVSVTWLFASSLVLSSPLGLYVTRFVADLLYARREERVMPTLVAAITVMSVLAGGLGTVAASWFTGTPALVRALLVTALVLLCDTWLAVVVLSGLRDHTRVTRSFTLGYLTMLAAGALLARHGVAGLLGAFVIGHAVLLLDALYHIGVTHPSREAVSWELFRSRKPYVSLIVTGLVSTLATWLDKGMFWLNPLTSHAVFGPLRSSEMYDLPLFLAYLLIVPGMSVFLVRIETDYAEAHRDFFTAVESGASLDRLERLHVTLVEAARSALHSIFKAQAVAFALSALLGQPLLSLFGISTLHYPLFLIDAAGVSMQVFLLSTLSLLFYLDRRLVVLGLSVTLLTLNGLGTWLGFRLGAAYYGYGFAAAVSITCVASVLVLDRLLGRLVEDTFMRAESRW